MSIGMTALKYWDKAKLFCKDTGSFIVHVKSKDVYPDLTGDVEKRFDTSIYKVDRPLSIRKKKKVISLMRGELGERIIKEVVFLALRPKMCSYLADDGHVEKKVKGRKLFVIKWELRFDDCKNCLENNKTVSKSQQKFRSEAFSNTWWSNNISLWLWVLTWYAEQNCWNM